MIKRIVCASVGVAAWAVVAAEGGPQAELLGSVEMSSFSAFQQKVVDLGTTINNPAVSLMAVPTVQNGLTEKYGKFRQNDPVLFLCYADMAALRKVVAGADDASLDKAVHGVVLYPCAEGPEKFLDSHPEAQKKADGTIELEDGGVLLYSADGRTGAFAPNARLAKQALASAAPSAAGVRPLFHLDVTEAGVNVLADLHKKMLEEEDAPKPAKKGAVEALLASVTKFQRTMVKLQNEQLRACARLTVDLDLDETGLVVKGGAKAKPGAPVSPAAGFRLPAGALDFAPAGSPLVCAGSAWGSFQNEGQYRACMNGLGEVLDSIPACVADDPKCAEVVKGLCVAGSDLLKAVQAPAPTDWLMFAFAFGPNQEPYLVGHQTCAQASQSHAAAGRFCAAAATAVEKAWPGILRAKDASLFVNWFRLVDVIVDASDPTPQDRKVAEKAKKGIAAVVGGPESVFGSELTSPTTIRSYIWAKGFTPSAAAPSAEKRLAAVLPETAAERPTDAFYLSLYSLVRDNVMPLVVKALPKQKDKDEIRSFLALMPPAGANGAIAGASWTDRGGARFVFRVTKDEIRNIAAAANAVIATQAALAAQPDDK